jgi:hypothetical protein
MINVRKAIFAALLIGASSPVAADQLPATFFAPFVRYDDAKGAWVDREGNQIPTVQAKSDAPAPSDIVREPIQTLPVDIHQRNAALTLQMAAQQASTAAMQLNVLLDIKRILEGIALSHRSAADINSKPPQVEEQK